MTKRKACYRKTTKHTITSPTDNNLTMPSNRGKAVSSTNTEKFTDRANSLISGIHGHRCWCCRSASVQYAHVIARSVGSIVSQNISVTLTDTYFSIAT